MPISTSCPKCKLFHPSDVPCTKVVNDASTMARISKPTGWGNARRKRFTLPRKTVRIVLANAQGKCQYCGCDVSKGNMEIDHIVPLYKGGSSAPRNLWVLCKQCHALKTRVDIKGRGKWLANKPKRYAGQRGGLR